jgi:hypothetical protein
MITTTLLRMEIIFFWNKLHPNLNKFGLYCSPSKLSKAENNKKKKNYVFEGEKIINSLECVFFWLN